MALFTSPNKSSILITIFCSRNLFLDFNPRAMELKVYLRARGDLFFSNLVQGGRRAGVECMVFLHKCDDWFKI